MRQLDRHGALHLYGSPVAKFIDRQSDRPGYPWIVIIRLQLKVDRLTDY